MINFVYIEDIKKFLTIFPFHKHSRQSHLTINELYYKYKKICALKKIQ